MRHTFFIQFNNITEDNCRYHQFKKSFREISFPVQWNQATLSIKGYMYDYLYRLGKGALCPTFLCQLLKHGLFPTTLQHDPNLVFSSTV